MGNSHAACNVGRAVTLGIVDKDPNSGRVEYRMPVASIVADTIRHIDERKTEGPKIYFGKTNLQFGKIKGDDGKLKVPSVSALTAHVVGAGLYSAATAGAAAGVGIGAFYTGYVVGRTAAEATDLKSLNEQIENNEKRNDVHFFHKKTIDACHVCAKIVSEDGKFEAIFTLDSGDCPIAQPLKVKEINSSHRKFKEENDRYKWYFVGGCKKRSLKAGLEMMRWKKKKINERGKEYEIRSYNCQTTTFEIVIAGSLNPKYAYTRMLYISQGI